MIGDRQAVIGSRLEQVQTPARFRQVRPSMSPLVRRKGLITLDPDFQQVALDFVWTLAPSLARSYKTHLQPVAEAAFESWPVKTGLSKSEMGLEYSSDGVEFTGSIVSGAKYSMYIESGGVRAMRDLVWRPGVAAAEAMVDDLAADLARGGS